MLEGQFYDNTFRAVFAACTCCVRKHYGLLILGNEGKTTLLLTFVLQLQNKKYEIKDWGKKSSQKLQRTHNFFTLLLNLFVNF